MSKIYDNWERLVEAVLLKEHLRHLALCHSRSSSAISDGSSRFSFNFSSYSSFNSSIRSTTQDHDQILKSLASYDQEVLSKSKGSRPLSFFCDLETGMICYVLEARDLKVSLDFRGVKWALGTKPTHISRFLGSVITFPGLSIKITGQVRTKILSAKVTYAAYLVFTLVERYKSVGSTFWNGNMFKRADGWLELYIKEFYVDHGDDRTVEVCWAENVYVKGILTVKCVEFRPKY